jgi:hypothetical protein
MSPAPVICFGQQPCGFFPKRFLVAKIRTARRLQQEIGGAIVFFYHDSDHDPRETRTLLRHRKLGTPMELNFTFANQLQRQFSPLYLKRVLPEWHAKMAVQLPAWVERPGVEAFKSVPCTNAADFCLEMYQRMGLLEGIRVMRSSDPAFRRAACEVPDFYVDLPYEGEIVRARYAPPSPDRQEETPIDPSPDRQEGFLPSSDRQEGTPLPYVGGGFKLHKGGVAYVTLPPAAFSREQVSPTRDTRLTWMQSVIHCTHYVSGASEQAYMRQADAPEITYVQRDTIENADEAYAEFPA